MTEFDSHEVESVDHDESNPSDTDGPVVQLKCELDPRINFALQQNDVRAIKALHLSTGCAEPLMDVELRLNCEPEFAAPWSRMLSAIPEQGQLSLRDVDLKLSPQFLVNLSERLRGNVTLEAWRCGKCISRHDEPVELLAYNEWSGMQSLPEILAAFVMPNHPKVEEILSDATSILRTRTGNGSLDGYQSKNPSRVRDCAEAVFEAIKGMGISYVSPPASFEQQGQRIRTPDQVLEKKLATCLDLAVLYAACLEQTGLNPLVVFVEGHAFCGLWLNEESYPRVVEDNVLPIRKRVELEEICVVETTGACMDAQMSFMQAVQEAERRLRDADEFRCSIDIRRARQSSIQPLPLRGSTQYQVLSTREISSPTPTATGGVKTDTRKAEHTKTEDCAETPAARLERWRTKLLDLTQRNRLLNFRGSKTKTLPLLAHNSGALEDSLASGVTFTVCPKPREFTETDPRDLEAHRTRTGEDPINGFLRKELDAKRLHADADPDELQRRLLGIYRDARIAVEEGGASALFIAIGFLKYREAKNSSKERLAPILLVPVELERTSIKSGFRLYRGADDSRANVTLLEYLYQDFEITIEDLDPLPQDDAGIDVDFVLKQFRKAVRDIDEWEVLDRVELGFFSFAKFLMWRDLQDRVDELRGNPIVEHLIEKPHQRFDPNATFPRIEELDNNFSPSDCFCPLDSDSSQLRAILAAAQGRSFVLEGPPGTGKSQTIANMIAHCLASGKTVLFVSEKMAALNVVHSRLEKMDLGRFCLELHSNKARKHDVIQQFDEALRTTTEHDPEEWSRVVQQLETMRQGLNGYVQALHRRRPNGMSVFQATSALIGLRDVPSVGLSWNNPNHHDRDALDKVRDTVEALANMSSSCGKVSEHPWKAVQHDNWSSSWQAELQRSLDKLNDALLPLADLADTCAKHLALEKRGWSIKELTTLSEVAKLLLYRPRTGKALLLTDDWELTHKKIRQWTSQGERRDTLRQNLFSRYAEGILSIDVDTFLAAWDKANKSHALLAWYRKRSLLRGLSPFAREGTVLEFDAVRHDIESARELRLLENDKARNQDAVTAVLGCYWQCGKQERQKIQQLCTWAFYLRAHATTLAGSNLDRLRDLRKHWAQLASEGREFLEPDREIGRLFLQFNSAWRQFQAAKDATVEAGTLDETKLWGTAECADFIRLFKTTLEVWSTNMNRLREWCDWREYRNKAIALGLKPLVDGLAQGRLSPEQLLDVFHRSYYQWWLSAVTDSEKILQKFRSVEHERSIKNFRRIDRRYLELTKQIVAAKLAEHVPAQGPNRSSASEVGILRREIGKKRRHTSIRQLMGKIPNLLPRLKPCILMSPMSIAQYLEPNHPPFDIVIFDEASQIPVWDAVGAIARGKQAIVVGDPKQLPPTTFFARAEEEEALDPDTVEDLESILEDCMTNLPLLTLDWHYRSRHETLIYFSNYHYYENRLLTFPSPSPKGMGVTWHFVGEGIYDKGKSRTNRVEAEYVVEEITRRLCDPFLCHQSIGVVTFSQAQQVLIEELLESRREAEPDLDVFFSDDQEESIFIKNLENVQGDERDVIIFSICYGPDSQGRVSMNFGPLNRDGGERRLNVAITRARRELLVFSSLRADQIDLARTRAIGVEHLKAFLDYAERGPAAIAETTSVMHDADFDSPFEKEVHGALTNKGWRVDLQVGCSGYRIDLAVVNPDAPGQYLVGIECDGATYHRAKTARDRDRLREAVLRDLGWEILRVWSTDWWNDPRREIDRLDRSIRNLQEEARKAHAEGEQAIIPGSGVTEQKTLATSREDRTVRFAGNVPSSKPPLPPYTQVILKAKRGSSEEFYEKGAQVHLRGDVERIVKHEGPVSLASAGRRIVEQWDMQRLTKRARDRILRELPGTRIALQDSGGIPFLWWEGQTPETYRGLRVPGDVPEDARRSHEIAIEEYANGVLHVLRAQISLPKSDLVRETARLFGFQRTGEAVKERIAFGVDLVLKKGNALADGDQIVLPR